MIIKRWLRWTLTSFLAVILILTLALGWLTASQSGFQWLVNRLLLTSVPELTIDHSEGRLIGAATLRGIYYKNDALEVKIKNLNFDWHPSKLLSATVDIDTLTASHITVTQIAPPADALEPTEASPSIEEIFNQLKLPVNININNIELIDSYFYTYQSDKPIKAQRFALTGSTSKKLLSVKKIELKSDFADLYGSVNISLEKNNRANNDIDGQFSWAIKLPDIKTVSGETILLGNIENININNKLAAPYDSSIDVTINDVFNHLNISSDIKLNNLQISKINTELPNYQIKGAINVAGNMTVASVASHLKIEELDKNIIINTKIKSDWEDKQLTIDTLTDIPGILEKLQLKGNIQSKLDNIDGEFSWVIKVPDLKTVYAETILLGKTNDFTINNSIAAPYDSSIDIIINDVSNNLNISSEIKLNNLQVSEINTEWPNYQIKGAMKVAGNADAASADSHLKIEELDKNIVINTKLTSDWKNKQLALELLTDIPGILEQLVLKGSIQPNLLEIKDSEAFALALAWKELNIPDTAKTSSAKKSLTEIDSSNALKTQPSNFKLTSREGELLISGNLKNYLFSLDTLLNTNLPDQQGDLTQGSLSLKGAGNTKKIALENIALSGSIGTLKGQGSINFQPDLMVALQLSGTKLNPAIVSTNWPGDLALELSVNTKQAPNGSPLIQTSLNASGDLRNHAFSLNTEAELIVDKNENHILTIEKLRLNSADSTISSDAVFTANKRLSANWFISSNNLEELIPDSKGALNTQGMVDLNIPLSKTPTLQDLLRAIKTKMTLSATNIQAFDTKIKTLSATADINWQQKNAINSLNLASEKISLDSFDIESISATLEGEPESHRATVDLESTQGNIDLLLSGQLNTKSALPKWRFTLESASIDIAPLAPWYLQNTMSGLLSENSQTINNHCWLSDLKDNDNKASICLEATNKDNLSKANFSISDLSVDYFSVFFPEGLSWTDSIINGQGNINLLTDQVLSSQQVNADITLLTTAGKLNWQTSATQEDTESPANKFQQSIQLEPGSFAITADKKEIKALLKLPIEKQTGFNSSLVISNNKSSFKERDIKGELNFSLNNIEPFNSFIPDSKNLKGKIDSQWSIGGSIAKPSVDGKLALTKGQLLLISPGILLEDITLTLTGDQQSGIEYQASFNSGGGILTAQGNMQLPDGDQGSTLKLSLKGEKVKVFDTEEAIIFASPDINVVTIGDSINITGAILIPDAKITPKKILPSVVSITEDQVIVNTEQNEPATQGQKKIAANIDIILGDAVNIDGFGFKGGATGSLKIIKQQLGPVLGNGKITIVDGEYRAFGQGLIIDKGLILFTGGPIAKPGIDIKALRRPAEGVTVGVFARGSLSQPKLTIFSEPSMTQSEQLSWLVLGRPLEQSSEGESNAISQLLLSLSLSKGDSIISNLSETFNLDTLSLKTGSGEAGSTSDNSLAELVLGKYLSPELYVSYGIGLFEPINVLSLEYSLSRYWKLISETSDESNGGDIVYTIEK